MARLRKRKHAGSTEGVERDEPPTKKTRTQPIPQVRHAVLNQFYPNVLTLRNYAISKLPASSRVRRRKIAAVGVVTKSPGPPPSEVERSLGALLDTTLVAIPEPPKAQEDKRWEGWKSFSQRGDESYVTLSNGVAGFAESQALIVEFVVTTLFSRDKSDRWPKHLLCDGYRRSGGLGLRAIRPNPHVEALQRPPWPQLLALLGESGDRIMIDLLLDCSIFVLVDGGVNNFCQISGKPLSEIDIHSPQSQETDAAKRPSELIFVRNRMLYARAALNARGMVQFGLRHIHVLNRSPYHSPDNDQRGSTEEQNRKPQNDVHTLRVMMYMFPRQFGLHNVFTSKVNLKETSHRLKDYTLREEEIVKKFGRLGDPNVRVRTPKRLRGRANELVRKLQILHQRCSYSELLQHYCPTVEKPSLRVLRAPVRLTEGQKRNTIKHPHRHKVCHLSCKSAEAPPSQI
ncbi:hypothetical protein F4775DRAFT_77264 [Biscogniauxia sp. FL1348]|nr:hypothetical protein F4775DRAFT_77264 [Biscogniauxia sp. FL1348]